MASKEPKCCGKLGLKPLTRPNLIQFYLPAQGFVSYTALSVSVINPRIFAELLPKKDLTNLLLFNAVLGTGAYAYSRSHMELVPKEKRVLYSGFGALLFTLGSVLLWAVLRGSLPDQSKAASVTIGVASSLGLTKLAVGYLSEIDKNIVKK